MRTIKFLSPSSIAKFYADRDQFYLEYLADEKLPREPQTKPMSLGSAFDAYIKSDLAYALYGEVRDQFAFETIFEEQVEEHNRDWARDHGKYVFEQYCKTGSRDDLLKELQSAKEEPKFEKTVTSCIQDADGEKIPLLGKPDLFYVNKKDNHIIYDWKCNGYCSKRDIYPKKGYVLKRDTEGNEKRHKDAQVKDIGGIQVNIGSWFEDVETSWSNQLSIYAWVLGEPIGSMFVVGIDQLVASDSWMEYPVIKVAQHRSRISRDYQHKLFDRISYVWNCIQSGHIFDGLSFEDNEERKKMLDNHTLGQEENELAEVL